MTAAGFSSCAEAQGRGRGGGPGPGAGGGAGAGGRAGGAGRGRSSLMSPAVSFCRFPGDLPGNTQEPLQFLELCHVSAEPSPRVWVPAFAPAPSRREPTSGVRGLFVEMCSGQRGRASLCNKTAFRSQAAAQVGLLLTGARSLSSEGLSSKRFTRILSWISSRYNLEAREMDHWVKCEGRVQIPRTHEKSWVQ